MIRFHSTGAATAALLAVLLAVPATALDIYGKRFDPPRAYLVQPSLNGQGSVTALQGQDNFLRIFLPPIAPGSGVDPDALTFTVTLPAGARVLDNADDLTIQATRLEGQPADAITGKFDGEQVQTRCLDNAWGIERVIWYRVDDGFEPGDVRPIRLELRHGGEVVFTDEATLHVAPELKAPPAVSPEHFRLYLHYGPHYRQGHYDELADSLRKAGINAIQIMAWNLELMEAMDARGFDIIAQRGGSYHGLYANLADVIAEGPSWFEHDDGGMMVKTMPYADLVILDAEPTPADYDPDPRIHAMFRDRLGLPDDAPMDEATVKGEYLSEWIAFRQELFATAVIHWAEWSRSLKPGIETILTEGRCNIFDPTGQIDYRNVGEAVTYFDPMNFAGLNAVQGMRKWRAAAPELDFMGCQNLAFTSYSPVFISPQTVGLQTLSAALLGNAGTSIYPGQTMDADNFIVFNRVMTLLGEHESIIWGGQADPAEVMLTLLPKEDTTITLGDGKTIRNTYPDWGHDAVARSYRAADAEGGDGYLTVVANWNGSEPCYARLAIPQESGDWMIVDPEHGRVLGVDGDTRIGAERLAQGVYVVVPPSDFRAFRVRPYDPAVAESLERLDADAIASDYRDYAGAGGAADEASSLIAYDDADGDGQFEYVVETDAQKVWISQRGHVVRWEAGDALMETGGLGLNRDQLYLPISERTNPQLDAPMQLRSRRAVDGGIELVFERTAALDSLGGMVDIQLTRAFMFAGDRPDIGVDISVRNTSLSMTVTAIDLSYRVHNHLASDGRSQVHLWVDTGKRVIDLGEAENLSIPAEGLDDAEMELVFSQYDSAGPYRIEALGEYAPESQTLLTFAPRDPGTLLAALRWRSGRGDQGTVEWMYRPVRLPSGEVWSAGYDMSLRGGVETLDHAAVTDARPAPPATADPGELLLHLDFEDRLDAAVARGAAAASFTGDPAFVDTPGGRGLQMTGDSELSFDPADNIDLNRGKLAMRFMPLWDGSDEQTHYLMILDPSPGHVYLAKLADGRLLMNMFDRDNGQHFPWTVVRTMKRQTWHELTVTWDAPKGRMALFLDGEKAAEYHGEPWSMGPWHGGSRLTIPGGAQAVIDDLKIWDRP